MVYGCTKQLVYKPASEQVISLTESVQCVGTVSPWGLDFTAIAHQEQDHTRLIVLSALGIKLLDAAVFADREEIYLKQEKFPVVAVQAFIRFARAELATACPPENIQYRDTRTRATFKATVKGGSLCR